MNSIYPAIDRWVLPRSALTETLAAVMPAGYSGREAGAFWLGERAATATVQAVVLPAGKGVEERPDSWIVSPSVFGAISIWAKPRNLVLLGMAHIHLPGVPVHMSWADRNLCVQVPGFLSVVIGNGGKDSDYRKWGWYVYEPLDFRRMGLDEMGSRLGIGSEHQIAICRADAAGVYEEKR